MEVTDIHKLKGVLVHFGLEQSKIDWRVVGSITLLPSNMRNMW